MRDWIKTNSAAIGWWALLVIGSLLAYWATRGTSYHQLAVGVAASAVTLLVATVVFEALWQLGAALFDGPTGDLRR